MDFRRIFMVDGLPGRFGDAQVPLANPSAEVVLRYRGQPHKSFPGNLRSQRCSVASKRLDMLRSKAKFQDAERPTWWHNVQGIFPFRIQI